MSDITIWHNPNCSKSRKALGILEERGYDPNVVKYLEASPNADEVNALLKKLGCEPRALMRTKEARYQELGLDAVTDASALVHAMVENPILIERPVIVRGERAVIGRPPERVLELLE